MPESPRRKLPVPTLWQASVESAMTQLAERLDVGLEAVAPAGVREAAWTNGEGDPTDEGIEIVLMARGMTYRYRALLTDPVAPQVFAVGS